MKQRGDSGNSYSKPELIVHGSVDDLTQQLEVGATDSPTGGGGTSIG
jgi:hypothetical protein